MPSEALAREAEKQRHMHAVGKGAAAASAAAAAAAITPTPLPLRQRRRVARVPVNHVLDIPVEEDLRKHAARGASDARRCAAGASYLHRRQRLLETVEQQNDAKVPQVFRLAQKREQILVVVHSKFTREWVADVLRGLHVPARRRRRSHSVSAAAQALLPCHSLAIPSPFPRLSLASPSPLEPAAVCVVRLDKISIVAEKVRDGVPQDGGDADPLLKSSARVDAAQPHGLRRRRRHAGPRALRQRRREPRRAGELDDEVGEREGVCGARTRRRDEREEKKTTRDSCTL